MGTTQASLSIDAAREGSASDMAKAQRREKDKLRRHKHAPAEEALGIWLQTQGIFERVTQLKRLNLSNKELETVPSDLLLLCPGLCSLALHNNRLRAFPQRAPDQPSPLVHLSLARNNIRDLPISLAGLVSLRRLNLLGNALQRLPTCVSFFQNLEELVLEFNRIETLPDAIGRLRRLRVLYVRSNRLATIPRGIAGCLSLERASFGSNSITTLPDEIGRLSSLQELNLCENRIATVPESLGDMSELQELYLSGNRLESLPKSINKLRNLRVLTLARNRLTRLPASLGTLPKLAGLTTLGNPWQGGIARLTHTGELSLAGATERSGNSVLTSLRRHAAAQKVLTRDIADPGFLPVVFVGVTIKSGWSFS